MKITMDGRTLDANEGQTILDVARANGIYIPALCWHPRLGKAGRCRACLVEIEGVRGLQTACSTAVKDGMKVQTASEAVIAARRMVVNLLLADGSHNCMSCETNGDCELQDMAYSLGIEKPAFVVEGHDAAPDESAEGIVRDLRKCIHCGRCVTACNHTVMHEVLDFGWRGGDCKVICDDDKPMGDSSCVQCGECVQVCPVGALIFKLPRGKARAWETEVRKVVCPYCGVGCIIDMHIKDGKYLWSMAAEENWKNLPNQGMLCVKGRFGLDFVNSPDRLTQPLVRRNGKLEPASWDEALDLVAKRLGEARDKHGPRAVGCFASAKVTNEENYAMMRFARAVLKTNNVDHCARLCHASTVAGLAAVFGSGAMTNSMQETAQSKVILITGSNTTWCHPVFGGMIKKAVREHGVKLIVVDPRETDLAEIADLHLRQKSGSDVAWLMGMQRMIINEGWHNKAYIDERCEGWDDYVKSLDFYTPEKVEELSGIKPDKLRAAAKLFATGGRAAVYFSMGITQHSHGVDNVKACANLSLITGNLGFPGGGVNPLRGQVNVQGACDMGALPNVFSGYQPVINDDVRRKFAEAWGVEFEKMDKEVGMTVTTMVEGCGDKIKAIYMMGENPMVSDPNLHHVEEQLRKLDFLVVQDIFLTETAMLADVVLPGVSFAEKTGTYTNTERRVQLSLQALPPVGQARQDYEIIADIASRMGGQGFPRTVEALNQEVRKVTPSYGGIGFDRLGNGGLRWPCPNAEHPGTPILHIGKFTRGKALLSAIAYRPPAEEPDAEYPLRLTTGRLLEHYHTGSMSRRSKVLDGIVPHGTIEISPADGKRLGVADGERVKVTTRRGSIETVAEVIDRVPEGTVFAAFHFAEAAANVLTNDALDPIAKIPEFKVCAARIEKATATR